MIVVTEWVKAQDSQKSLAGCLAWQYCERDDTLIIVTVPKTFSRESYHCDGIWWMEIIRPPIPAAVM